MVTYLDQYVPLLLCIRRHVHSLVIVPYEPRFRLQRNNNFVFLLQLVIQIRIQVKHIQEKYILFATLSCMYLWSSFS